MAVYLANIWVGVSWDYNKNREFDKDQVELSELIYMSRLSFQYTWYRRVLFLGVMLAYPYQIFPPGTWPALMTVWSKAPPLNARYLSPLHVFEFRPRHVRKLLVTWS